MVFMGDVAGGSAIVPRREGGPAHTQSFVSEPKDCGLGSTGAFFFFFWGWDKKYRRGCHEKVSIIILTYCIKNLKYGLNYCKKANILSYYANPL